MLERRILRLIIKFLAFSNTIANAPNLQCTISHPGKAYIPSTARNDVYGKNFLSSEHSLPSATTMTAVFTPLSVAIVGGGISGLACAVSLRRAGHHVTIYERFDYASEVGATISCAANGGKWLYEWGVDVEEAKPVILRNLVMHDVSI